MASIIFRSHLREVQQATKSAIDIGMNAVAKAGEGNAKREITMMVYDAPPSPTYVRTGALRNSLTGQYVPAEQTAYIGTNISYAPYVEFGTTKMTARPYLRNAAQNYADQYKSILEEALSKLS